MSEPINPDKYDPIDLGAAFERIGGDASFLTELLDIYFREYTEKRRLLEEAIARQDFGEVSELGHSLKGASANLSLTRLHKAALSLEMAGRERKIHQVQEAADVLENEIANLKTYLEMHPLAGSV